MVIETGKSKNMNTSNWFVTSEGLVLPNLMDENGKEKGRMNCKS